MQKEKFTVEVQGNYLNSYLWKEMQIINLNLARLFKVTLTFTFPHPLKYLVTA